MKKFIYYIYNFFFLSINWNPVLAIFVTWHELKRGSKYRIYTIKREKLEKLTIENGDITKSSPYEAVTYYLLEKLLSAFRKIDPSTNITDLGCGKGRVLVVAAHFGFTTIIGVEFANELCEKAGANMRKLEKKIPGLNWKVINKNVMNYEPGPDDNVFFLFNPFDRETLQLFLRKNEMLFNKNQKPIYFIYASPVHLDVLLKNGYKNIYHINPARNLEAVIVKKEPVGNTMQVT